MAPSFNSLKSNTMTPFSECYPLILFSQDVFPYEPSFDYIDDFNDSLSHQSWISLSQTSEQSSTCSFDDLLICDSNDTSLMSEYNFFGIPFYSFGLDANPSLTLNEIPDIQPFTSLKKVELKQPSKKKRNEKTFVCDVCHCSFARKHDLQRHSNIHTGIKPYSCLNCSKAFRRTDALKHHLRAVESCRNSPIIQAMKATGNRRYRNL